LFDRGKILDGLRLLDDAVDRGDDTATTWFLMGKGLLKVKEYAQAIGAFEQAIERKPDDPETRYYLAESLFQMGDVSKAVEHFEDVARNHNHLNAWCNLATIIPGDPKADNERIRTVRLEYAAGLAASESNRRTVPTTRHGSGSPLRVGYVSAFFPNENYMKPVWQLIRSHDRSKFQVHLFADDATETDFDWFEPSEQDRIHLTSSLSNESLVDAIRDQQLDVVIDLNAYSVPWRLSIYTHRLAPVVAAWFNMYATSGLPGIDWIVGDRVVIPEIEEVHYSEKVARLPQCYLSFDVDYATPDLVSAPCLTNSFMTFGSLISQYKVTPAVYDAWARILSECNDARLLLGNRALSSACNRDYVLDQFIRRDINPNRITCLPPAEHHDFLKYYGQIDIALDAFPYNGGTTTTEAMWQGVPTLAVNGDRWASRTSATLMLSSQLGEFVAESVGGYVNRAIAWASDPLQFHRLGEIRSTMRDQLQGSSVCDSRSMVRGFEQLLLDLHAKPPGASNR
jgi:protein O-GlcNAc transferase